MNEHPLSGDENDESNYDRPTLTQGCEIEWDAGQDTPFGKNINFDGCSFQSPTPKSDRRLRSDSKKKSPGSSPGSISPRLGTQPRKARKQQKQVEDEVDFIYSALDDNSSPPQEDGKNGTRSSLSQDTIKIQNGNSGKIDAQEFNALLSGLQGANTSRRRKRELADRKRLFQKGKQKLKKSSAKKRRSGEKKMSSSSAMIFKNKRNSERREAVVDESNVSSIEDLLSELKENTSESANKKVEPLHHDRRTSKQTLYIDGKSTNKTSKIDKSNNIGAIEKEKYNIRNNDKHNKCIIKSNIQGNGRSPEREGARQKKSDESFEDDAYDDMAFDDEVFAAMDAAVLQQSQMNPSSQTSKNDLQTSSENDSASCTFQRSATLPISNKSSDAGRRRYDNAYEVVEEKKSDGNYDDGKIHSNQNSQATLHATSRESDVPAFKPDVEQSNPTAEEDDEFDDFPVMDFDEMDKLVAEQKPAEVLPEKIDREEQTGIEFVSNSRYRICYVEENIDGFSKTLGVKYWKHQESHNQPIRDDISEKVVDVIDGCIHLHDEWYHNMYQAGDVIHICSINGRYRTDSLPITLRTMGVDDDLVLILHPDSLITPTAISDTVGCLRRAVLKARYGSSGLTSKAALFGQMRHDLFEKCLIHNDFSTDFAKKMVPRILRDHAEQLIGAGLVNERESISEIQRTLPNIRRFAMIYTNFLNNKKFGKLEGTGGSSPIDMCIDGIHGTEEMALSTELGIKGFIDATVEVSLLPARGIQNALIKPSPMKTFMGIELKTGHNQSPQHAHMTQLALYTLSLRSRYGSAVSGFQPIDPPIQGSAPGGMLLYLNNKGLSAVHISPQSNEVKSLVNQRNVLAQVLRKASEPRGVVKVHNDTENEMDTISILPPTPPALPDISAPSSSCERCYLNRECMLNAAIENSDSNSQPSNKTHKGLLQHFTGHLKDAEIEYLKTWDRLIDLEASGATKEITKAWLKPSMHRESTTGKTMSSLVIDNSSMNEQDDTSILTIKLNRSSDALSTAPLNDLKFEIGSRVVLSTDGSSVPSPSAPKRRQIFSLTRATIKAIDAVSVYIRVGLSDFRRIRKIVHVGVTPENVAKEGIKFRLDKDDFAGGSSTLRQNLVRLFTSDILPFTTSASTSQETMTRMQQRLRSRAPHLRRSIIHLDPPQFHSISDDFLVDTSLANDFSALNSDQQAAVRKVVSAADFSLIQGFPGTGKTSIIVFIARVMVALGKRVLVTSYTHAAVDNILLKLIEHGDVTKQKESTNVVRIGPKSACHLGLHKVLASEMAAEMDRQRSLRNDSNPVEDSESMPPSISSLNEVISCANIVGVSALTIPRSPLLFGQEFDLVIVDEAGQINQPACIGAIMAADKFLLVGDHEQLPPLVQNDAAEIAGYGISMLKRLADEHPDAVAQLTLQYRMHLDICNLPNLLVYKGNLKCANDEVRKKKLMLSQFPRYLRRMINPGKAGLGWLVPVLNPNKPVAFVSTDAISQSLEVSRGRGNDGGGLVNDIEVSLTKFVVQGLQGCGLDFANIGIISPYRAQVARLGENPFLHSCKSSGLEISTIDRYQGRDKKAIILSLVRSNKAGKTGRLLDDKRRLNVALSRAKMKLIIIGSFDTLSTGSLCLSPVLKFMKEKGSVEILPPNAVDVYKLLP